MAVLKLGIVDKGKIPYDKGQFLQPYHRWMATHLRDRDQFRDEANFKWNSFEEIPGREVSIIQRFLHEAGFFPNAEMSGIFGYGTQAAVRLFQEYVRNYEGDKSIGIPDGIVGTKTWQHTMRWQQENIKCEWADYSWENPTQEFKYWISILKAAKRYYKSKKNIVFDAVRTYPKASDTVVVEDWEFDAKETHLIGIRRKENSAEDNKENNDLFILLINGLVFKFWGSTDPSSKMTSRPDEAYLVEGQHKYRMSWHKISNAQKIYKALRPYSRGVLVYRDQFNDNALTEDDISEGLDEPNTTINIHWSGDGHVNFSAGCQVIAGRSYIAPGDNLIDCTDYSSPSYAGLSNNKTRGAYNVLSDLVVCFNKLGNDAVWYTLGREKCLKYIDKRFSDTYLEETVQLIKSV